MVPGRTDIENRQAVGDELPARFAAVEHLVAKALAFLGRKLLVAPVGRNFAVHAFDIRPKRRDLFCTQCRAQDCEAARLDLVAGFRDVVVEEFEEYAAGDHGGFSPVQVGDLA